MKRLIRIVGAAALIAVVVLPLSMLRATAAEKTDKAAATSMESAAAEAKAANVKPDAAALAAQVERWSRNSEPGGPPRNEAQAALVKIGMPAVAALQAAQADKDPEKVQARHGRP